MNCTVCGNPLLFDRTVFHCSCDAYVHAYCWDEHVLRAHRPSFEIGKVTLDGEFIPREIPTEERVPVAQVSAGPGPGEPAAEEETTPLLE